MEFGQEYSDWSKIASFDTYMTRTAYLKIREKLGRSAEERLCISLQDIAGIPLGDRDPEVMNCTIRLEREEDLFLRQSAHRKRGSCEIRQNKFKASVELYLF